ncbi:histamine H3 receptor-like [Megalops cyprinoides]|uniref:histamine H3 receptor-like n=1 Tax=Megalops cyprinoides TaxID=118141 RepID=UPI00186534EB|nr:histamine H3 receptor-like [Megalops cyprinoides]
MDYTTDGSASVSTPVAFSSYTMVILAVLMVTLVVVTVIGNALVIFAFKVDRSLRRQSNYFFLNLAISDFLVGAFCIPVYIPYILTGRWMLGRALCKLWLVMDYLLCTASVFNIVLISYDRFLSVTRAVTYRAQQGLTNRPLVKMIAVWVLAFLLYGPAIIFWEAAVGKSNVPYDECFAEFYYTWYFLLCASTLEFFSPFVSVAFFNLSIYLNIRRRNKRRASQEREQNGKLSPRCSGGKLPAMLCRNSFQLKQRTVSVEIRHASLPVSQVDSASTRCAQHSRLSRDKKIAKSLAIIVCVFGICWAPYTLLMIIRAACRGRCVEHLWYEITFWLLWLNSAINPFLYPLCHQSFRRAFAKILCPKRQCMQPQIEPQSG